MINPVTKMMRAIRNLVGRMYGYCECGVCRDTYNWKPTHLIQYTDSRGVLVVCEECWSTAPDYLVMDAARKVAALWLSHHYSKEDRENAELMVAAVEAALKTRHARTPNDQEFLG